MDKQELYQRAEKVLNQALEAARKSVKLVAKKAGEAAQVSKLLIEKLNLEHRVAKQFTRLGGCVYEKAAREGRESLVQDPEILSLVEEAKRLESELSRIEAALESEKKQRPIPRARMKSK